MVIVVSFVPKTFDTTIFNGGDEDCVGAAGGGAVWGLRGIFGGFSVGKKEITRNPANLDPPRFWA